MIEAIFSIIAAVAALWIGVKVEVWLAKRYYPNVYERTRRK